MYSLYVLWLFVSFTQPSGHPHPVGMSQAAAFHTEQACEKAATALRESMERQYKDKRNLDIFTQCTPNFQTHF